MGTKDIGVMTLTFQVGTPLPLGKAEWMRQYFLPKGRGLGHVTPKMCGKRFQISSKIIWVTDFKFGQ